MGSFLSVLVCYFLLFKCLFVRVCDCFVYIMFVSVVFQILVERSDPKVKTSIKQKAR